MRKAVLCAAITMALSAGPACNAADGAPAGTVGGPCLVDGSCLAGLTCTGTTCAACPAGHGDCDRRADNGCEVDLRSAGLHCGSCERVCPFGPDSVPACSDGVCALRCDTGRGDCDEDTATGCEVDIGSSVADCGACARSCNADHGTPSCSMGSCAIACATGFDDCNHDVGDGCEADIGTDLASCGACGRACELAHAEERCMDGQCLVAACDANFDDCDRVTTNGCEADLLNDPSTCGRCSSSCTAGWCRSGTCAEPDILSSSFHNAGYLAVDATGVYVFDLSTCDACQDGAIRRIALTGGAATTIVGGQPWARELVMDSTGLYWIEGPSPGRVRRVANDGTGVADIAINQPNLAAVAVDATHVYWASGGTAPNFVDARVFRRAKVGGATETIATNLSYPLDMLVSGGEVYLSERGTFTAGVYNRDARILAFDVAGGPPRVLATSQDWPHGITADATHVFWVNRNFGLATGQVERVRRDGTGAVQLLLNTTAASQPVDIESRGGFLFVATTGADSLFRIATDGSGYLVLARNSPANDLAVDATHAYFSAPATQVKRVLQN